jgi:sugar phosphate isomerase/epimerase
MRFGGPLFTQTDSPREWAAAVLAAGYSAAYCPLGPEEIDQAPAYEQAARAAGIVIAEVGAWSNPLSPDAAEATAALRKCQAALALADRIGARCCVNIAGSRGLKWDGPDPADLTKETFELIVAAVRAIIDAVQPKRTFYTLETMPWMFPDSPDAYLRLLRAVDRPAFAAHLDPVNLVCSPQRYFTNRALLQECFAKLGPQIRSCHAKDILLRDHLTVHLDEVRPGLGRLDYSAYLNGLRGLDGDTPLMLEHLPDENEYRQAGSFIRAAAAREGIAL